VRLHEASSLIRQKWIQAGRGNETDEMLAPDNTNVEALNLEAGVKIKRRLSVMKTETTNPAFTPVGCDGGYQFANIAIMKLKSPKMLLSQCSKSITAAFSGTFFSPNGTVG